MTWVDDHFQGQTASPLKNTRNQVGPTYLAVHSGRTAASPQRWRGSKSVRRSDTWTPHRHGRQ